jgi:hypothetical protein
MTQRDLFDSIGRPHAGDRISAQHPVEQGIEQPWVGEYIGDDLIDPPDRAPVAALQLSQDVRPLRHVCGTPTGHQVQLWQRAGRLGRSQRKEKCHSSPPLQDGIRHRAGYRICRSRSLKEPATSPATTPIPDQARIPAISSVRWEIVSPAPSHSSAATSQAPMAVPSASASAA